MDLSKYLGETTVYEKKVMLELKKPKSWLKTVSSFANGKGGKLFFGIDDNDNLIGVDDYKNSTDMLSEIIKSKLDPIPNIDLEIKKIDGKSLVILTVFEGKETPYYVINGGERKAYIRIGNESVIANSSQLKNLVLKGFNMTFDALTTDMYISDVSFSNLKSMYYQKTLKHFEENDFLSFGLADDNNKLTNAGALFADGKLIYQSRIFCTRWNGLDKVNGKLEAIDDKEYEGNLLYLLQNGLDFIKANSKKMWKKSINGRIEYPDYPERAYEEALVNALIHRDYLEIGSEIHIDMYDDRLEIYSPGGMVDGTVIQKQNPYNISSKRRNPIISDVFSRMHLMERRGSGIKKILESYYFQEKYNDSFKPEFRSTHSSFFITLKNLNYTKPKKTAIKSGDKKAAIKSGDKPEKSLKIKDKQINSILLFSEEINEFKTSEIEDLLNVKSSRARYLVSYMVKEGMLLSVGENRNRYYKKKK